jgi:hypothetical protein
MIDTLTFKVVTALHRLLDEIEYDQREGFKQCSEVERARHPIHDINFLRGWLSGDYEGERMWGSVGGFGLAQKHGQ